MDLKAYGCHFWEVAPNTMCPIDKGGRKLYFQKECLRGSHADPSGVWTVCRKFNPRIELKLPFIAASLPLYKKYIIEPTGLSRLIMEASEDRFRLARVPTNCFRYNNNCMNKFKLLSNSVDQHAGRKVDGSHDQKQQRRDEVQLLNILDKCTRTWKMIWRDIARWQDMDKKQNQGKRPRHHRYF